MSDITINETPYILQKYSIEKHDGAMETIGYQAMRENKMLDGTTQYQFLAGAKPDGYEVLREIVDEVNTLSKTAYESGMATNFVTDTTLISEGYHIEQLKNQGLYLERQAFTNNAQGEKIIIETMGISKTTTHNNFTQNDQKKTERTTNQTQENIISFSDITQDMPENTPIPMQSMPGKTMSFNDQPGRRGAEIVDEDGTRIGFGGKEAIDLFVRVNKLSKEDMQTLKELDAKKYSLPSTTRIAENENALKIPMRSKPDSVMIYNDQPGRQGVEVWKQDGTHVAFGSEEAINRFVKEHKLSPKDVQTLNELNSRKDTSPTNKPQENIIAFNDRTQEKPATINQSVTKQDTNQDMPETVSNRYLRINDKYYFQDKTMAFEDRGNNLKLETENHAAIKDALVIAETRNWQSITVSGSNSFKHQVWREASLKGIEVAGYTPSKIEEAEFSKALALLKAKEIGDNPKKQGEKLDKNNERVLVMTGQRFVQNDSSGQWETEKVDKAGSIKPGIYNTHLSTAADKTKNNEGVVLHTDNSNVYQLVGKGIVKHNRRDFDTVPDVGQTKGISYGKLGKAIVAEAATAKLSQGLSR
jgi:hypothetical protein